MPCICIQRQKMKFSVSKYPCILNVEIKWKWIAHYLVILISGFVNVFLQYYAESHALIYIVDSSDRDRIPDSKEAFGMHFVQFHM